MNHPTSAWICCQLGAREHYAIPRALQHQGMLSHLITDAWVKPGFGLKQLPIPALKRLQDRYHVDLAGAKIRSFTSSLIWFELSQRRQQTGRWERIMARNQWFQQQALQVLQELAPRFKTPPTLFCFSYAALELLRFAQQQGWRTILGQIDPGRVEEDIVRSAHQRHPEFGSSWQGAPAVYWTDWLRECELVDTIIVNSPWSRWALEKAGIPATKLRIIPLAYEVAQSQPAFSRSYPMEFTAERPLRVLFLGQIVLRKGIIPLLEAVEQLQQEPIEFWLVGPPKITIPPKFWNHPRVRWFGAVPRSETAHYYQQADVFLFPTLSDGFGLTQLEAQAWRLPLIASPFCGRVVQKGENGILLPEVTGTAIARSLRECLHHPQQLQRFAEAATSVSEFSLGQLEEQLVGLSSSMEQHAF